MSSLLTRAKMATVVINSNEWPIYYFKSVTGVSKKEARQALRGRAGWLQITGRLLTWHGSQVDLLITRPQWRG